MSTTKKASGRFKVGDWVSFPYGARTVTAQVIEERGPIGVNRRRLYRIRLDRESTEPDAFEMPEDELENVPPPFPAAIMNYMKEGGLVDILRSNLGGGRNQPRAWLTYTPRGEVTHTLEAGRGVIGGSVVPFFALHEDKVFAGKENEVVAFLASFGLNRAEAKEVVSAVGTAP